MHQEKRARERDEKLEFGLEWSQKDTTDSMVDMLAASMISASTNSSSSDVSTKESKSSREPCHVCAKKPSLSKLVRTSHRKCGICKERACSKCNVKRKLFGRTGPVNVLCCKICILESKKLSVDPRDPCPVLQ